VTGFRVGVDIGGTFTDIVLLGDDGSIQTKKISSTVKDYAQAIADGLSSLFDESGLTASQLREILHGTTVAANAILEHKGAKTGLIATKGFRDILEIRNLRVPQLYNIGWQKPEPLVERYLRVVVDERITTKGEISRELEPADVDAAIDGLLAEGVEAIAICLLNSFANPAHERMIEAAVRAKAPDLPLSVSADVLPEIKEYERTSTVVVNAYVKPIVERYLRSMRATFDDRSIDAPLLLMQSNGGLTTAAEAMARPVNIVESGPAGGVIGAQHAAERLGLSNLITLDMGGTTAKAALIEGGKLSRSPEFQVGGGILTGSRLLTGAGYLLKLPAIDLAEVGAGGGSIISIDAGGSLRVGPRSAGAEPGPLCYDQGGEEATVTDANLLLGYLNPNRLVGGDLKLDAARTREVFERDVARRLSLDVEAAAHGAHRIAAANMIRAIRAVSTERGRDPRGFSLFAFGGNGPVFAAEMARELGIDEIVLPPAPGLFSAFGLLAADVEHHYSQTIQVLLQEADPKTIADAWSALEKRARDQLAEEGFVESRITTQRTAELHYKGQTHELTAAMPDGSIDRAALDELAERFHREHERTYGHRASEDEPIELVTIQVVGIGLPEQPRIPDELDDLGREVEIDQPTRQAYFGPAHGWLKTPVLRRSGLTTAMDGPCIVEEYDATCVVPPDFQASLDERGNIRMRQIKDRT